MKYLVDGIQRGFQWLQWHETQHEEEVGQAQYRTLGRIMTGYSIRRLRIYAVLITWGNYNRGVIHDEVKNTVVQ